MSNDLIRRGDVRSIFEGHYLSRNLAEYEWQFYKEQIDLIPAVPHEMSAREYLETEARMCKYYGLPCAFDLSGLTVDEAISMVEKFAREHPEERSKK